MELILRMADEWSPTATDYPFWTPAKRQPGTPLPHTPAVGPHRSPFHAITMTAKEGAWRFRMIRNCSSSW